MFILTGRLLRKHVDNTLKNSMHCKNGMESLKHAMTVVCKLTFTYNFTMSLEQFSNTLIGKM
jgi:hypothetical protein